MEDKSDAVCLKELEMLTIEKELDMQMKLEREKMERDREIEGMKIQMEREKMEHDRELQLTLKEIEMVRNDRFDISKHVCFVPPFQDKGIDKYFLLFEKVATDLNWALDKYTILLQCVLKGKACGIYFSLSAERTSDYQVVKATVLKGYQLVPEAYRQIFGNYKKESDKTFVEFVREKERLLETWCTSGKVANSYDNLRQLILLEEFKNSVYPEVKTYINEQKADTVDKAARMAYDYTLWHKLSFNKSPQHTSYNKSLYSTTSNKLLNIVTNKHSLSTAGSPFKTEKPEPARSTSVPTCGYCKKKGHILSDCYILKRRQERNASSTLPQLSQY